VDDYYEYRPGVLSLFRHGAPHLGHSPNQSNITVEFHCSVLRTASLVDVSQERSSNRWISFEQLLKVLGVPEQLRQDLRISEGAACSQRRLEHLPDLGLLINLHREHRTAFGTDERHDEHVDRVAAFGDVDLTLAAAGLVQYEESV
jgi:hypothetical protein